MLGVAILGTAALVVGLLLLLLATASAERGNGGAYGMCAPARYRSMTSADYIAPMQPYRAPQPARVLAVPWPVDDIGDLDENPEPTPQPRRVVYAQLDPEPQPVVVPDWPRRVEVDEEPTPVVVNHTAARFGALELRGGA